MLLFIMDMIILLLKNRDKNVKIQNFTPWIPSLRQHNHIYKNWTRTQLEKVFWMNESPFKIFGECSKAYVSRCPGEEFNAECLTPIVKQGGESSFGVFDCHKCWSYVPHGMIFASEYVWANFNAPHMPIICAVRRCKHQILFQQDNDPKHTRKSMEKVHWTSSVVSPWWLIILHSLQI